MEYPRNDKYSLDIFCLAFFFSIADTHCVPINCLVKRLLCLSTDKNIIHNLNYVFKIYILYANVYKSDYIGAQM